MALFAPARASAQPDVGDADMPGWGAHGPRAVDSQDVEAREAPAPAPPLPAQSSREPLDVAALQLSALDMDLTRVGEELRQTQRQSRAYVGTWFIGHAGLATMSGLIAATTEDRAVKGAFALNAALASGMLVHLVVQGWPALGSTRRFERMPDGTVAEKVAKTTFALNVIAAQRQKDRIVNEIDRHIGVLVASGVCGLGIGFGFGSLLQGLTIGVGVLAVGELAIVTRPNIYSPRVEHPLKTVASTLRIAPMADRYTRGVGVSAQF